MKKTNFNIWHEDAEPHTRTHTVGNFWLCCLLTMILVYMTFYVEVGGYLGF